MSTLLTYDNLTLHSSEIIDFTYSRQFNIVVDTTVGDRQITQPGNLSPTIIEINTHIHDNATTKFTSWIQKVSSKPLSDLNFLTRNLGQYYLSSVDISSAELTSTGDILRFSMKVKFTNNQNF